MPCRTFDLTCQGTKDKAEHIKSDSSRPKYFPSTAAGSLDGVHPGWKARSRASRLPEQRQNNPGEPREDSFFCHTVFRRCRRYTRTGGRLLADTCPRLLQVASDLCTTLWHACTGTHRRVVTRKLTCISLLPSMLGCMTVPCMYHAGTFSSQALPRWQRFP